MQDIALYCDAGWDATTSWAATMGLGLLASCLPAHGAADTGPTPTGFALAGGRVSQLKGCPAGALRL